MANNYNDESFLVPVLEGAAIALLATKIVPEIIGFILEKLGQVADKAGD